MTNIYPAVELLVGGRYLSGEGRDTTPVINPSTGEPLGDLWHASGADIETALEQAEAAFRHWRTVPAVDRAKLLNRVAALIRERRDALATLVTLELGKPLAESHREVATAADMFAWHAAEAQRIYGQTIPARASGIRQVAVREPLGPIAGFSAWNAPAVTPSRKIAGALAAGCSIIMKPAEETPATALALAGLVEEAGAPPGLVNVLFGDPAMISTRLLESPVIRGITFTGSTAVGKLLARQCVPTMKRATLELGGHAPVIVFPDVDVDAVAAAAVAAKLRNSGQLCTSPTRFYIHASIFDRFVTRFTEIASDWPVGDPFSAEVRMGPVANDRRRSTMEQMTEDALSRGGRVATGGAGIGAAGYFWKPTLLVNATENALAANTEPFGPLAIAFPFDDMDDVIAAANRLPFGLAAYVMSADLRTGRAVAEAIESGSVIINNWQVSYPETPFGGLKESGIGSEGGTEGLRAFQNLKFISEA